MNIKIQLSKRLSRISPVFIWILLCVILLTIILIPVIMIVFPSWDFVSKFLADIFSPVSLRQIAYPLKEANVSAVNSSAVEYAPAIAYAIGFIVLTIILIPIVTNHLRTMGIRYVEGTLDRYTWRKHVLFLGFDSMMLCALKDECKQKKQVVIAVPNGVREVRDRLQAMLSKEELKYVEVVQCNKCDTKDLERKARVKKASKIFIIGEPDDPMHDANNIKSLDVLLGKKGSTNGVLISEKASCYIHIRNIVSFSMMQRQGFYDDEAKNRVMAFNFYENIAGNVLSDFEHGKTLMLLDEQNKGKSLKTWPDATVHLVILGMTPMGTALAREAIMVAHYPNHRLKITMVDENAHEEMFYFMSRQRELFQRCKNSYRDLESRVLKRNVSGGTPDDSIVDVEFEFIQGNIAHPKLVRLIEAWAQDNNQIMTLAVCTNDSPRNMATALYLPNKLREKENESAIQVWVYQHDDNSTPNLSEKEDYIHVFSPGEYGNLTALGDVFRKYVEFVQFVYDHTNEIVNEGGNDDVRKGLKKFESERDNKNKNVKTWEGMSQFERWSNIHLVRSMVAKLRGIGYVDLFKTCEKCENLDLKDAITQLCVTEQFRWNVDTLAKGFRPTDEEEHRKVLAEKYHKDKESYQMVKDIISEDQLEKYKKELLIYNGSIWKNYRGYLKKEKLAHDDIRPYEELDEKTKKINEVLIRAIEEIIKKKDIEKKHHENQ